SATCVNALISQYPATNGQEVTLNDLVLPISGNQNQSIYKITNTGSLGVEGPQPDWGTCQSYQSPDNVCTDSNGVQFTNQGQNACRSDVGLVDVTSAHAAP